MDTCHDLQAPNEIQWVSAETSNWQWRFHGPWILPCKAATLLGFKAIYSPSCSWTPFSLRPSEANWHLWWMVRMAALLTFLAIFADQDSSAHHRLIQICPKNLLRKELPKNPRFPKWTIRLGGVLNHGLPHLNPFIDGRPLTIQRGTSTLGKPQPMGKSNKNQLGITEQLEALDWIQRS